MLNHLIIVILEHSTLSACKNQHSRSNCSTSFKKLFLYHLHMLYPGGNGTTTKYSRMALWLFTLDTDVRNVVYDLIGSRTFFSTVPHLILKKRCVFQFFPYFVVTVFFSQGLMNYNWNSTPFVLLCFQWYFVASHQNYRWQHVYICKWKGCLGDVAVNFCCFFCPVLI